MSLATIYEIEGGAIVASDDGLTICAGAGNPVTLPIGRLDLAQVGDALIEFSSRLCREEIQGNELGSGLVQTLLELRGKPQAESFRALRDALTDLVELNSGAACGGFAAGIVNVFEVGVANLPGGRP